MMQIIYQTVITQIGLMASDALQDNMMITFKEGAPDELADFCFIHREEINQEDLSLNCQLWLDDQCYPISAIGEVATLNLRQLGHLTIRFDGANEAELPGSIHVNGITPKHLSVGTIIKFTKN